MRKDLNILRSALIWSETITSENFNFSSSYDALNRLSEKIKAMENQISNLIKSNDNLIMISDNALESNRILEENIISVEFKNEELEKTLKVSEVYKTPKKSQFRSYKILEVSKMGNVSKESQAYYDKFTERYLGIPWTDSEEYQRGLVIDKIMEEFKSE